MLWPKYFAVPLTYLAIYKHFHHVDCLTIWKSMCVVHELKIIGLCILLSNVLREYPSLFCTHTVYKPTLFSPYFWLHFFLFLSKLILKQIFVTCLIMLIVRYWSHFKIPDFFGTAINICLHKQVDIYSSSYIVFSILVSWNLQYSSKALVTSVIMLSGLAVLPDCVWL